MAEHTPLPWVTGDIDHGGNPATIFRMFGEGIADCDLTARDRGAANASYIVQACNAFPDLVKALEAAREYLEGEEGFRPADRLRDEIAGLLTRVKSTGESND